MCNWSEFYIISIEFDNQIIAFANDENSDSDTNNNNSSWNDNDNFDAKSITESNFVNPFAFVT